MGPASYLDSFENPKDYEILYQDRFIGNDPELSNFTAIIKKHLNSNFSTHPTRNFVQSAGGCYTFHSSMNQLHDLNGTNTFSGEVISFIPTNPITILSCLWWQKTNQLIQSLKE